MGVVRCLRHPLLSSRMVHACDAAVLRGLIFRHLWVCVSVCLPNIVTMTENRLTICQHKLCRLLPSEVTQHANAERSISDKHAFSPILPILIYLIGFHKHLDWRKLMIVALSLSLSRIFYFSVFFSLLSFYLFRFTANGRQRECQSSLGFDERFTHYLLLLFLRLFFSRARIVCMQQISTSMCICGYGKMKSYTEMNVCYPIASVVA